MVGLSWGGANHYASCEIPGRGVHYGKEAFEIPMEDSMRGCPTLSPLRPYSPGTVSLPEGAPRLPYPAGEAPREPRFGKGDYHGIQRLEHLNGQQKISGKDETLTVSPGLGQMGSGQVFVTVCCCAQAGAARRAGRCMSTTSTTGRWGLATPLTA